MFALQALARAALRRLGGSGGIAAGARTLGIGVGGGALGAGLFGGGGGDDGRPRRRRRKRVLTANDRADISFITATLGAPAGKAFAMIVAARV